MIGQFFLDRHITTESVNVNNSTCPSWGAAPLPSMRKASPRVSTRFPAITPLKMTFLYDDHNTNNVRDLLGVMSANVYMNKAGRISFRVTRIAPRTDRKNFFCPHGLRWVPSLTLDSISRQKPRCLQNLTAYSSPSTASK